MGGSSGLRQAIWDEDYKRGVRLPGPRPHFRCIFCRSRAREAQDPDASLISGHAGEGGRRQSENGVSQAHGTVGPLPSPATARLTFLLLAPRQPAVPSERWRVKGLSLGKLQNAWETLGVSCVRSSVPTVRPHPRIPAAPTPQANVPPSQI